MAKSAQKYYISRVKKYHFFLLSFPLSLDKMTCSLMVWGWRIYLRSGVLKQVIENTIYVNEQGEVLDRVAKFVSYGKRMGYNKLHSCCYAEVPLWFWSIIIDESKIHKPTGCLGCDLSVLYSRFKNKKTFRKYISELEKSNFLCRIGVHSYIINPMYIHHGTQESTEHAIVEYNIVSEAVVSDAPRAKALRLQAAQERRETRTRIRMGADAEHSLGETRALYTPEE